MDNTDKKALNSVIDIWVKNIQATIIPILNYSLDFFWRLLLLLSIIFVSMPVYTTTPVTQSVIFKLHPLNTMLLLSRGTLFQDPVNVWIKGFGLSYLNYYLAKYKVFSSGPFKSFSREPNSYFTCLYLRFVYPSKFIVSMKQLNLAYELCSKMTSAGKN